MSTYQKVETVSLAAAGVLPAYRFVTFGSGGTVGLAVASARADGVTAQAATGAGEVISVALMSGIMKVEVGTGGVTAGALVSAGDSTTNAGRAVAAATTLNTYSLGVALQAGDAGDIISVLLHSPDRHGGAS